MNEIDKHKLNIAWKVVSLFIYALLTIGTCSAVWNSRPGPFISVVAVLLFLANAWVIYRKAKKMDEQSCE